MVKNHIKRLAMPKTWPVQRKAKGVRFATTPSAGKLRTYAMPLNMLLKEVSTVASNARDVKALVHAKAIHVNGRVCNNHRMPIGLFDVITLPASKTNLRVVLDSKGRIALTDAKDAQSLLYRIENKTTLSGGKRQLQCFNGYTLTVDKDAYAVGDSLVVEGGKPKKHLAFKEGASCLLIAGRHAGAHGTIKGVEGKIITVTTESGEFTTQKRYAYVTGEKSAEIKVSAE